VFKKTFVIFLSLFLIPVVAGANETKFTFSPDDRVLVIAPHPDDETLGLGGLLQRAKASNAQVRVLYLTNGESNEVASIFYQKRPLLLKSDFVKSGGIRRKEALEAMASIGIKAEELIFFGYPDGGMLNIWLKYWGQAAPYRSLFTRFNKVPYKEAFAAGHAFKGDEVVRDMERVLLAFQPTQVFVTAPFDLNPDHQAAYLYLQAALMNISETLQPVPSVQIYLVHAHRWPVPKKFRPGSDLTFPTHIDWDSDVRWNRFPLTSEEVKKKGEAILLYKSQLSYKKAFLLAFARKNEIFADYPVEKIPSAPAPPVDGSDPFGGAAVSGDVRYKVFGNDLWIDIPMSNMLDEMGALSSYVFGYRRGFLFSEMPKLAFKLFGNKMFVYDGARNVNDPKIVYRFEKDRLHLRVPLKRLKNPEFLFVSTRNAKEEMSLDFGSWRLLEIVI